MAKAVAAEDPSKTKKKKKTKRRPDGTVNPVPLRRSPRLNPKLASSHQSSSPPPSSYGSESDSKNAEAAAAASNHKKKKKKKKKREINPAASDGGSELGGAGKLPFISEDLVECPLFPNCAIITVGHDSAWRVVDCEHLSFYGKDTFCTSESAWFAGGFFYWVGYQRVVVMDVETEVVWELVSPDFLKGYFAYPCPLGNYLYVIKMISTSNKWNVWKLTDLKSGTWTKLYTIDLENQINSNRLMRHPRRSCYPSLLAQEWGVVDLCYYGFQNDSFHLQCREWRKFSIHYLRKMFEHSRLSRTRQQLNFIDKFLVRLLLVLCATICLSIID